VRLTELFLSGTAVALSLATFSLLGLRMILMGQTAVGLLIWLLVTNQQGHGNIYSGLTAPFVTLLSFYQLGLHC